MAGRGNCVDGASYRPRTHCPFLYEGYSPEMLAEQFPTVPLAHIHKVIAFYLDNKADVDALVKKHKAEMDKLRNSGRHPNLIQLRQRFESLQQARLQP